MLKIKIKTPTKSIFDGTAEKITLPTINGDITILTNHSNLLTVLNTGLISIDATKQFIIINGVAKIRKNIVEVLTEEGLNTNQENLDEIQAAIKAAQEGKPTMSILTIDLIKAEKQLKYYLLKKH